MSEENKESLNQIDSDNDLAINPENALSREDEFEEYSIDAINQGDSSASATEDHEGLIESFENAKAENDHDSRAIDEQQEMDSVATLVLDANDDPIKDSPVSQGQKSSEEWSASQSEQLGLSDGLIKPPIAQKNWPRLPFGKIKQSTLLLEESSVQLTETAKKRSLDEIGQELKELNERRDFLTSELERAAIESEFAENASQDFAKFASNAETSIAWRLKLKFSEILGVVTNDINNVVSVAENIKLEDIGLLNKLKQVFLRRFWISIFTVVLFLTLFFLLRAIFQDSSIGFALFINSLPVLQVVTIAISIWLSSFFGMIVAYYKTWSQYERNLRLAEVELAWVKSALQLAQESKFKLTKLYAHAEQWVELLSMSLLNPWQTDSRWEASAGSVLSDEKLPNSVTVAQAVEGSAGAMAALERTAAARLLRPGWREQVFARQIAAVAKHLGIQPGKLDYEVLDKDSPSIPNGSRKMFLENFQTDSVQISVARSYLNELSVEVQTIGLLESKPPVKNDYVDDLEVIAEDLDALGEIEIEQSWDGFLLEIVGDYDDPIIPISPLSFTDRAVIENLHGTPSVHIQMPSRLRALVGELDSSRISISAHADSAKLPLDLVVRIDAVGPLDPGALKLWNNHINNDSNKKNVDPASKTTARCRTCGRENCPSLIQGSDGVCSNSGV